MNDESLLHVAAGEVRVGRKDQVLTALLGSCVGIGVIWRKGGRCALAHCLLPASTTSAQVVGARFVDQGVTSLLRLLRIEATDYADVDVVVAGGANMLGRAGVFSNVGQLNADAAQSALASNGLRITHLDVGGRRGRRISINCASNDFEIVKFNPYQAEEADHANH